MDDDLDWSSILNGREFSSQTPQHDILVSLSVLPLPLLRMSPETQRVATETLPGCTRKRLWGSTVQVKAS